MTAGNVAPAPLRVAAWAPARGPSLPASAAAAPAAAARLYDGTHLQLPGRREWTWHVTCVRDSRGRDVAALRDAATELVVDLPWRVEDVAYLELRGDRYVPLARWSV